MRKRNKGKTFSDGVYEFSNSTRRSFLRKIKGNEPGLSNNSMDGDIKELAVYSDVESLKTQHDEERIPQLQPCNYSGYLRVEKRSFNSVRLVSINIHFISFGSICEDCRFINDLNILDLFLSLDHLPDASWRSYPRITQANMSNAFQNI